MPVLQLLLKLETKIKESGYTRSLVEAFLDPLVTIGTDGTIIDMNEALTSITGMTHEIQTDTDFLNCFTEPKQARKLYDTVYARGSVAGSPLTLRHKNGNLTDVLFDGAVYKDDQGDPLGLVIVTRDVTEQNKIAKALNKAIAFAELSTNIAEEAKLKADSEKGIAEDVAKAKQQFLSNMSHEIRTPMNAIIGFTKVVLKTDLNPKQREYLTAIKTSGDALIVLINDILDLAKVDAGKMIFIQTPFRIESSVSSMIQLFELKIREKNIKLIKDYDPNIPSVLLGDPVRLHQIILNLLSNAVKFTKEGAITFRVSLLHEEEDKVMVEFVISDTGIGIEEDQMKRIFENFQQATSETSRLFGGTGLGLAIVKQLVEAQGGTVTVKSVIEKGSDFSFILTFKKTTEEAGLEPIIVESDTYLKNIKVLVVEDLPLNQLLMRTLLEDFGFECDIAANGKIAIAKLQSTTYDVVLMDLQMPEMNGFEASEYIRHQLNSKIPIIALTADVTTADLAKCKAVGMDDYISKPVDDRQLKNKIILMVTRASAIKTKESAIHASPGKDKYIDLAHLRQRTKSDVDLMSEIITLYLGQTTALQKEMVTSTKSKDWKELQAIVHKMIPSFSIVGISSKYEDIAKKLQEYTRTGENLREIPLLVQKLESVLTHACTELEIELELLKKTAP